MLLMPKFQLPRGVTGVLKRPTVDAEQFRVRLYDVRRRCGYRIVPDAEDSQFGIRSYASFVIEQQGITKLLLLNMYGPFLGFAAGTDKEALIHGFIDCSDLVDEFASFRPLEATVLNASPTRDQLVCFLQQSGGN